jgi:broad specificity phosphatase PhoE
VVTTVYLVRHGVTDWNVARRIAGRLPGIALSADGRREAAAVASRLAALPIRAVAASPIERAHRTAAAIARAHGLAVAEDAAFTEREYARWQGMLSAEIRARDPDAVDAVARGDDVPGVEPVGAMAARMWNGMERLVARHPGEALVIVSHADPIRALIARIVGMPPARLRALEIGTASLSRLRRRDAGAVVDFANSRAHLAGPPGTDSPGEGDQDRPAGRPLG